MIKNTLTFTETDESDEFEIDNLYAKLIKLLNELTQEVNRLDDPKTITIEWDDDLTAVTLRRS